MLQPLAFLPAACTPLVHAAPPPCTTLTALLGSFQAAGTAVYGAHLPWGVFNLSRLLPQRYVQQHMLYAASTRKRIEAYERTSGREADTITALLQVRS